MFFRFLDVCERGMSGGYPWSWQGSGWKGVRGSVRRCEAYAGPSAIVASHASSGRRSFTRFPPLSIDVSSDLGLLHVVDALPLTHPGLVRGPCSPSPQASRAWRAYHHVKIVMYPFSMISPPKIAGKGTPRLSAMGGRAGCNPDSPLRLTTKCRLPPRDFKKIPHF